MVEEMIKKGGGFLISINEPDSLRYKDHQLRVPGKTLLITLKAVAVLLSVGAKIDTAMRASVSRASAGKLRYMLASIARRIEATGEVANAFAAFLRVFPPPVLSMLKAHEKSGSLDKGLEEICEYFDQMEETKGEIIKGAFIPILGGLGFLTTASIIFGSTLPRFKGFISEIVPMDELNGLTRFFFGVSDFVVANPFAILVVIAALPLAVLYAMRFGKVRRLMGEISIRLPFIGDALKTAGLSRLCNTYAALARVGFKPVETLEMSAAASGHTLLADAAMRVREAVLQNKYHSIGEAFEQEAIFPDELKTGVSLGEDSLMEMFTKLGSFYTREAKNKMKMAVSVMEPAMTLLVMGFAMLAALSIMLPLAGMIKRLTSGI
jgi:type IV pilus assembly protein PilC